MASGNNYNQSNCFTFSHLPYYQWPSAENCSQLSRIQAAGLEATGRPASPSSPSSDKSEPIVVSPSVKIICPNEKNSEHKVFLLNHVNFGDIETLDSLRDEIFDQFGGDYIDENCGFDLGYYKGSKRIWMRNDGDLKELTRLLVARPITLWCSGRKKKSKKRESSDSEDEQPRNKKKKSSSDERLERVDDIVDELRQKNKSLYSILQYRVWAETIVGGRHVSLDNPPKGSFFKKSGSPERSIPEKRPAAITPIRAADLKSTYIKQIRELHSLQDVGAITEADFQKQKKTILDQMDQL
jgi:hypothetical protein